MVFWCSNDNFEITQSMKYPTFVLLGNYLPQVRFSIGTAMVSSGEMAQILATLGLNTMNPRKERFAVIVAVVLENTIVSPPLMKIAFNKNVNMQEPTHPLMVRWEGC